MISYNTTQYVRLAQVICPTAPNLPVTINGGAAMPAWSVSGCTCPEASSSPFPTLCRYDIVSLDEKDGAREDMEGVDWAVDYLHR